MKEKKLTIVIDRPVEEIYHFITNPSYTHLWFDSIREEFSDHYPPQVGTKYTNRGDSGEWLSYTVVECEQRKRFTLSSDQDDYSVQYTLSDLESGGTQLAYHEWVKSGELCDPCKIDNLLSLKYLLEMNIVIHPLTYSDLLWCEDLSKRLMGPYFDQHLGGWDDEKMRDGLQKMLESETGKLVLRNSIPVGMFQGRLKEGGKYMVDRILVDDDFQGQGIGKVMMEYMELEAKELGAGYLELIVFEDNPAVEFYKHLEYKENGKYDESRVLLRKTIHASRANN